MAKNKAITVQDITITWRSVNEEDYISLTDMVRKEDRPDLVIANWMRTQNAIEFLGLWEKTHNPNFKSFEFEGFLSRTGSNQFALSPKQWIEKTDAIGIFSKKGRGGGTYAHRDIAFAFGAWISASFQYLLIREFQRLKEEEASRENLEWNANRFLTKRNYALQTEAIKRTLLPQSTEPPEKDWLMYAGEADVLNMALFGTTAKAWRDHYPTEAGKGENIRDQASNIQLIVLSNLEAINAELIKDGLSKEERFVRLSQAARDQLEIFNRDGRSLE